MAVFSIVASVSTFAVFGTAALAGTSLRSIDTTSPNAWALRASLPTAWTSQVIVNFVLEFAFVLTMIAEHLSTWSDEWVLWSTVEFNFIKVPQAYCTGSSIMPQKINPDVLELIRGKTARVIGNLQSLLVLIKGLPLAYNRDLQEDKPQLFDSFDTVLSCLRLAVPITAGAVFTERVDRIPVGTWLSGRHHVNGVSDRARDSPAKGPPPVGALVGKAMQRNLPLAQLTLSDFQEVDPELDETVLEILGVRKAIEAFRSYGSTAPAEVDRQITHWQQVLDSSN